MLNEKIIDLESGQETIRPFTKAEVAATEAAIAKSKEKAEIEELKQSQKAELFAKLGITEDEAKLLFS
jgi:hypothetical protein